MRDFYRNTSDFKKGYQPKNSKNEKSDLVTDCHNTLDRWRKHFYQLYIVHGVNGVRQTDIHKYIQTAEPPVP
jgi:hypothetical protein